MQQPYRLEGIVLHDVGGVEHTRFDFPPIAREESDISIIWRLYFSHTTQRPCNQ